MKLTNISKSFDSKNVIRNLSLTIEDGKCVAVMGESGCGKTTLINILLGLVKPDSGTIEGMPDSVSIVFQEDRLCDAFSPYDNISSVLNKSDYPAIIPALKALGLEESIYIPVCNLSGGMKRRVAILRALLYPSDMLIMDEPFTGLDEATRDTCIEYVRNNLNGRTLILITHNESEAKLFTDHIINL